MAANYLVTHLFFPEPSSITMPCTFFKQQIDAGNVEDVTSVGESIEGTFKTDTTYNGEAAEAAEVTGRPAT